MLARLTDSPSIWKWHLKGQQMGAKGGQPERPWAQRNGGSQAQWAQRSGGSRHSGHGGVAGPGTVGTEEWRVQAQEDHRKQPTSPPTHPSCETPRETHTGGAQALPCSQVTVIQKP